MKTLDESRHGLPNMLLSGTSFNFAIWKSESNQTHVSGRTLRRKVLPLFAQDQRDHDNVLVLVFDERIPEIIHSRCPRVEIDVGRQRDAPYIALGRPLPDRSN